MAIAVVPLSEREELKPKRLSCGLCAKPASRADGMCARHSGYRLTTKARQDAAREMVQRDAVRYAKLLRQGAERAAAKGDTEPAQWALIHGGAIKPVAEKSGPNVGVQVYVGTVLPGLREGQ